MNRQQRRRMERQNAKLSRNATAEEIFPPNEPHAPIQTGIDEPMRKIVTDIQHHMGPNYTVTLFIAQVKNPTGQLPRFNYASTAEREDMLAVLDAFVQRYRKDAPVLDKIEQPPQGSA
jgi:hypothetical protein